MSYPTSRLGEIATVIMGLSPKGESVTSDPAAGLPLLNGPTEFGPVNPTARQWASDWARESLPGDVLFCVRGSTTGRMNIAQTTYAIGRGIAALRGPTLADTRFIFYTVAEGLPKLLSLTSGSVFPNISAGDLKGFELPWPDPSIRAGIAGTLGALDDKIESNRRSIDLASRLLDALASQAAAKDPLTKLGYLVEVPKQTINPTKLGAELVDHFSLPAFDEGGRPERVAASTIMSNKQAVPERSILLSRLNPRINRTWWATPTDGIPALASTEFLRMKASSDLELAAVWLALRSEDFLGELPARVTGTSGSHQRVRPDDVLAIDVPDVSRLPDSVKQSTLGLLENAEQKDKEIAHLAALRDALLPELLSGRIRVPEAADTVAEVIA